MLRVKNEGGEFLVQVLGLAEMRGPAAVAQGLYQETDASKVERARVEAERKAMFAADVVVGKPNKKDRRVINRWRGR
jgi:ribosome-associated heat shock protein Hsp15